MMKYAVIIGILSFFHSSLFGQERAMFQKAIDHQYVYINQCTDGVERIVHRCFELHNNILLSQRKPGHSLPQFTCPTGPDPFYKEQAQQKSGETGIRLKPQSEAFQSAYDQIEGACQSIETAFRLKKPEKDSFASVLSSIQSLKLLVSQFQEAKLAYENQVAAQYQQQKLAEPPSAFITAGQNAKAIIDLEKTFVSGLACHFNPAVPTRWPVSEVEQHIREMALLLEKIKQNTPQLPYPASHYYQALISCAESAQRNKKDLLDAYTTDAQESDEHANYAYWLMMNDFNGCTAPFWNQFASTWPAGKRMPLLASKICPNLVFNVQPEPPRPLVGAFLDQPYQAIDPAKQTGKIPANVSKALNTYVDFVNESTRVTNNLLTSLCNDRLNQTEFPAEQNFYFSNPTIPIPRSQFLETTLISRDLPPAVSVSIQSQTSVLMRIMTEMDELSVQLNQIAKEKSYKTQGTRQLEVIRDRYKVLFQTFDTYKERLYSDLKRINDSYTGQDNSLSWVRSYNALTDVLRADRNLLDNAKKYYNKETTQPAFDLSQLESAYTASIGAEFSNMKGIEKLGRYNGLCPYSPYEDIGTYAQRLQEYAQKYEKKQFHDFLYLYNNSIDEYNRFAELSKMPLLRQVRQVELFTLEPPPAYKPKPAQPNPTPQPPVSKPETKPVPPVVLRDTVYIHDTIYLEKPPVVDQSFYSLEGFAPNNLILLLDISNSMDAPDRLPLLQSSISTLVNLLRPEDNIAVVVFSGKARTVLPYTSGKDKKKILKAIDALKPGGNTDVHAGLEMAYQLAQQHYKVKGNNRIVLATDGEFNLSKAAQQQITQHAGNDISLSIFKFGQKPTPGLKAFADMGKGNLVLIRPDNAAIFMIQEARK